MSTKILTNRGGSATVFIIVGVILAVALIGSIYFINQRGEQVRRDQAIAAYDKQQADKKAAEEAKKDEETKTDEETATNGNGATPPVAVSDELPITGPELAISELIGAGFMTTSIAGYISSRLKLTRSL